MAKQAQAKGKGKQDNRAKMYPVFKSETYLKEGGDHGPMTDTDAKLLVGWEEVDKDGDIQDKFKKQVKLINNTGNRPLNLSKVEDIAHDILNGNWSFNGEPMLVGEYGTPISLQHRCIALVFACQQWEQNQNKYPFWDVMPTIETIVNYGIKEDMRTIRTIDTMRARTDGDSFYSAGEFKKHSSSDRVKLCGMLNKAIYHLWERTVENNASKDNPSPYRKTHSDVSNYLELHPHVRKAVEEIHSNNGDKNYIGTYIPVGWASAFLYLMGASDTDGEVYRNGDPMQESGRKGIDWSKWEAAKEFWIKLSSSPHFANVRTVKRPLVGTKGIKYKDWAGKIFSGTPSEDGSFASKLAVISKAWGIFKTKPDSFDSTTEEDEWFEANMTESALRLNYIIEKEHLTDDETIENAPTLDEKEVGFGGIDVPEPEDKAAAEPDAPDADGTLTPPTPEEIEAKKLEEKEKRIAAIKAKAEARKKSNGKPAAPKFIGKPVEDDTDTDPANPSEEEMEAAGIEE